MNLLKTERAPTYVKQLYRLSVAVLLLLSGCTQPISTLTETQTPQPHLTSIPTSPEQSTSSFSSTYIIENEELLNNIIDRFIKDNHLENQVIYPYRMQIMVVEGESINIFLQSEIPDGFHFVWKGQQVTIIYSP